MNDENYYKALRALTLLPEWKIYEDFLNELEKEIIRKILEPEVLDSDDLNFFRASVIQIREVKSRIWRLIRETEEAHKRRNQKCG